MNYYVLDITTPQYSEEQNEILIAILSDLPFDTFEETPTVVKAYVPESDWNAEMEQQLTELSHDFAFSFEKTFIPYQNWNVIWESNFQPIQVDDFVGLRADFHPPTEGVKFDTSTNIIEYRQTVSVLKSCSHSQYCRRWKIKFRPLFHDETRRGDL